MEIEIYQATPKELENPEIPEQDFDFLGVPVMELPVFNLEFWD